MKKITFAVFFCLVFMFFMIPQPANAAAGLVSCGLSSQDKPETPEVEGMCTTCDILKMVKTVIDFVTFTVTPIVATLLILIAGFILILGGASPEIIGTGKKMFTNTIIGVVIIYSSFMIANFFIKSFAGDWDTAKSWFKLDCKEPVFPTPAPDTGGGSGGTGGPNSGTPIGGLTANGFRNSMSEPIEKLRACISSKLSTSFATVTSTTDNNIASGKCDPLDPNERFQDKANNCSHTKNSCHYGGSEPACQQYGSYALDYVSTDRATSNAAIQQVVFECDPKAVTFVENVGTTNEHVHVSIGKEYGCGCDDK